MSHFIQYIRKDSENEEPYSDTNKHEKMESIELLSFRDIKGYDGDDKTRNDEECLEKIHEKSG